MTVRGLRTLALLVVMALLAIGCSSDSDSDDASGGGSDDTADDGGSSSSDDLESPAEAEEAYAAADRYVNELGGEQAFAAVLLALDRGYAATQLIDPDAVLLPDGTIEGVEPEGEPVGATDVTGDAAGTGGAGDEEESLGAPQVELVSFDRAPAQDGTDAPDDDFDATQAGIVGLDLTPHQIYANAEQDDVLNHIYPFGIPDVPAAAEEDLSVDEALLVYVVLILALNGYDSGQIAYAIATGDITDEPDSGLCFDIEGEDPHTDLDRFGDFCEQLHERNSRLTWSGDLEWTSDSVVQEGPTTVIIRRSGENSNDFTLVAKAATKSEHTFADPGSTGSIECTSVQTDVLRATGTFAPNGQRLLFDGTQRSDSVYSGCPGDADHSNTSEWTDFPVEITEDGLTGDYSYGTFTLTGPPPPEPAG